MDFSELIAAADPSIFTESIKAWVSGLNINSVIMLIMMIFMIVGAIDRIRGNKLGYGEKFEDGFNAIGSCLKKEYTYRIYNSHIRNAFYVNRAWFYTQTPGRDCDAACGLPLCGYPRLRGCSERRHRNPHHRAHGSLL